MKRHIIALFAGLGLAISSLAMGQSYNLSLGLYPPCTGNWSINGNIYLCQGNLNLASNDQVLANSNSVLSTNSGYNLSEVQIGNSSHAIELRSSWGNISVDQSQLYGGTRSTSGSQNLSNGTVYGNLNSGNGGTITLTNMYIEGNIYTTDRVVLNNSVVKGNIFARNGFTSTSSDIDGQITATHGAIVITGGTLNSDISTAGNNQAITLNGVALQTGSIQTAGSTVTLNNSQIGSSQNPVAISGGNGVNLDNSQVVGSITATGNLGANVNTNNNSQVIGNVSAGGVINIDSSSNIFGQCVDSINTQCDQGQPLQCLDDDFNRAELGSQWAVASQAGPFGLPRIVNNRLRLTDASNGNATAASLLLALPSAGNRIEIEFDFFGYGGTNPPADGITLTLSDASVTPQAGGRGGSLGYAQRVLPALGISEPGFSGGWLGLGLDAFGNYSNPQGKQGGPGQRPESVAVRGSGASIEGYRYLTGTASLSPSVSNLQGHRYRVVIDNSQGSQVLVSLERRTSAQGNFELLIPAFDAANQAGQAALPANLMVTFTASTGGQNNIHEIDNLRLCAQSLETPVQIHHFELDRPVSQGLTCEAMPIQIRACMNADCSQQYDQPLDFSLLPQSGWASNPASQFNSGDSLAFLRTQVGSYSLGVVDSLPMLQPFSQTRCMVNGLEQANCDLLFADAQLRFFADAQAGSPALSTLDLVAGDSASLFMRLIATDPQTGVCQVRFANNSQQAFTLSSRCQNPEQCSPDQRLLLSQDDFSLAIPNPENPINGAQSIEQPLLFAGNATAELQLQSGDVGLLSLQLRHWLADIEQTPSQDFMEADLLLRVRPASLHITQIQRPDGQNLDLSQNINSQSPGFALAGQGLRVQLEGRNRQNQATPNFGRVQGLYPIDWQGSQLLAPAGGRLAISDSSPANHWQTHPSNSAAIRHLSSELGFVMQEVGIISLQARLDNFLGSNQTIDSPSQTVGRFLPGYFDLSDNQAQLSSDRCGLDHYLGMPFGHQPIELSLQAYNIHGEPSLNYGGPFARLAEPEANYSFVRSPALVHKGSGLSQNPGQVVLSQTETLDGQLLLQISNSLLQWQPQQPAVADESTPFAAALDLHLPASWFTDSDGRCFDPGLTGQCQGYSLSLSGLDMALGRLRLLANSGPEFLPLAVPVEMQIFESVAPGRYGFMRNSLDSCSAAEALALLAQSCSQQDSLCQDLVQQAQQTGFSGLHQGLGHYLLPAAGSEVNLALELLVPSWLQSYDPETNSLTNPRASYHFGLWQGRDGERFRFRIGR